MSNLSHPSAQFRAFSNQTQGFGTTPQEALNALLALLPEDSTSSIAIVPYNRGDSFFTQDQQNRLQELRVRRDNLTAAEQMEWENLVAASFDATIARTQMLQNSKL